jgi:hypothetical protein
MATLLKGGNLRQSCEHKDPQVKSAKNRQLVFKRSGEIRGTDERLARVVAHGLARCIVRQFSFVPMGKLQMAFQCTQGRGAGKRQNHAMTNGAGRSKLVWFYGSRLFV